MADRFQNVGNRTNPADIHFAIVPSDTSDMEFVTRGIYCQADGTAQIMDAQGTVLPYTMTRGMLLPIRVKRILATGTSGTFYGWM